MPQYGQARRAGCEHMLSEYFWARVYVCVAWMVFIATALLFVILIWFSRAFPWSWPWALGATLAVSLLLFRAAREPIASAHDTYDAAKRSIINRMVV